MSGAESPILICASAPTTEASMMARTANGNAANGNIAMTEPLPRTRTPLDYPDADSDGSGAVRSGTLDVPETPSADCPGPAKA